MVKNTVFKILLLFTHSVLSDSLQTLGLNTPGFPVLRYLLGLLKLMSIESVMPSNHLILCCSFLLLPSVFPSIRVFSNELVLQVPWPNIGASALASVLPMNIQGWFPLGWTGLIWASMVAQLVKNLPAVQETLVRFLCWEDPLEKG